MFEKILILNKDFSLFMLKECTNCERLSTAKDIVRPTMGVLETSKNTRPIVNANMDIAQMKQPSTTILLQLFLEKSAAFFP